MQWDDERLPPRDGENSSWSRVQADTVLYMVWCLWFMPHVDRISGHLSPFLRKCMWGLCVIVQFSEQHLISSIYLACWLNSSQIGLANHSTVIWGREVWWIKKGGLQWTVDLCDTTLCPQNDIMAGCPFPFVGDQRNMNAYCRLLLLLWLLQPISFSSILLGMAFCCLSFFFFFFWWEPD